MSSRPTFFGHPGNHNRRLVLYSERGLFFPFPSPLKSPTSFNIASLRTWLLKQETHLNIFVSELSLSFVFTQIFLDQLFPSIYDNFRFSDHIFFSSLFCLQITHPKYLCSYLIPASVPQGYFGFPGPFNCQIFLLLSCLSTRPDHSNLF